MSEYYRIVYSIVLIIGVSWALYELIKSPNKNKKSVADEPFYIPGVLEKKPVEKKLRRVNDITTEMLRNERYLYEQYSRVMRFQENIVFYKKKLELINIRLSIKQTKP